MPRAAGTGQALAKTLPDDVQEEAGVRLYL